MKVGDSKKKHMTSARGFIDGVLFFEAIDRVTSPLKSSSILAMFWKEDKLKRIGDFVAILSDVTKCF